MTSLRVVLIPICLASTFAAAQAAMEALIGNDPVSAATASLRKGDGRHIVLPICKDGGEVIPGSIGRDQAQVQKAMDNGWRPITCADIGDDPKLVKFYRVMAYADKYNRQLFELGGGAAK